MKINACAAMRILNISVHLDLNFTEAVGLIVISLIVLALLVDRLFYCDCGED